MKNKSIWAITGYIVLASSLFLYSFVHAKPLKPEKKSPRKRENRVSTLTKTISLKDKIEGIFILGAYGDAHARITEFTVNPIVLKIQRPDSAEHNGYPAIPHLKSITTCKPYARFTDDTHMSLYVAHGLLQSFNQSLITIMNALTTNFISWNHADQGSNWMQPTIRERAPGKVCQMSCVTLSNMKHSSYSGVQLWSRNLLASFDITTPNHGLKQALYNNEGGSGALMRTAPVTMIYYNNPELAEQIAVAQGVLTHTDSSSRAACAGFNAALKATMQNKNIIDIFNIAINTSYDYDTRAYIETYEPSLYNYGSGHFTKNGCSALCKQAKLYFEQGLDAKPFTQVLDEFRGWGASEALAAALYIFATWNDDPYLAMSIAINRTPGDSDTIAKLVGELLGAQYGYTELVKKFAQHNLDLDAELQYLENLKDLPEYLFHFPEFLKNGIKTFKDLAHNIAELN